MRGAPAWQKPRSVQHPSTVSALRADPPSPTRGEGKSALLPPLLQTLVDNVQENYRTVSGGGAPSG
ncbi:MAG: hypothetical protein E5Y67_07700 [Mesorhizobium sp.]|nr:MAG: hypothetical protein EOQ33_15460 [Mesorhizobium sp.]RWP15644.1 MAG: hypothetical protein EOR00_19745 [Mesorhizobium sp.]RWP22229.1 MAG: hypothetical protein EOR01_14630 [Mesorhizobium sp.]TIM08265.1 MAG: hypothetical protein E5Y62_16065 [Mesorhizobium sp.]TIM09737.1 MAG: hypothetical protein E5Y62_10415 [Mesorhizobium sp.]